MEFKDLNAADKLAVVQFIEENIEKHFVEHQRYETKVTFTEEDPGIELNEDEEIGEADIKDVWYECSYYDSRAKMHCGKSQMDESDAIQHAMWHLDLREKDVNEE